MNNVLLLSSGTIDTGTAGTNAAIAIVGSKDGKIFTPPPLATQALPNVLFLSGGGSDTVKTKDLNCKTLGVASGTVIVPAGRLFKVNNLIINGGTIDASASNSDSIRGNVTISSGTLTAQSAANNLVVGGSWSRTGGTFTQSSATVVFNATTTGKTINTGGTPFTSVTFNGTGGGWTVTTSGMNATNFTLTNGTFNFGSGLNDTLANLTLSGGTLDFGSGTLKYGGTVLNTTGLSGITPGTAISIFTRRPVLPRHSRRRHRPGTRG